MAKKRKRGLSGSPQVHRREAHDYYKHARYSEKQAKESGSCKNALGNLTDAIAHAEAFKVATRHATGDFSRSRGGRAFAKQSEGHIPQGKLKEHEAAWSMTKRLRRLYNETLKRCARTDNELQNDRSLSGARRRRRKR